MKTRHFLAILIVAGLILWNLASCNMTTPVSISQRISDFQADLNTSDRSNIYQDFHPTMTVQYNALKNPGLTINTPFPPPPPSYSLSIVDQSNPSAVIVAVNPGGSGSGLVNPYYLSLAMATYNNTDWRIVTLSEQQN